MRMLIKKAIFRLYKPYAMRIIAKDRQYSYQDYSVYVPKGIFHPGLFFSTKWMLQNTLTYNLQNKTLLEVGCGSGLISIAAAKAGAIVTAIDINPLAVQTAQKNAKDNKVNVEVIESNMFSALGNRKFDYLLITPPYYKKNPKNDTEKAWYCGEYLEYFELLFSTLAKHLKTDTTVLMILSEDCDIQGISHIANANQFKLNLSKARLIWLEENYIFNILPK